MSIQRVHVKEGVKHPWRLDMAKTIEAGGSDTAGHNGFTGKVTFEETSNGLLMYGWRRRLAQPNQPFEPQIVVFTPWSNVKWTENGPNTREFAGDAPRTAGPGEGGKPKPKDRPLGAQP